MELNITEADDVNTQKYWEPLQKVPLKKKRVTFDDILLNMNLLVNEHGVLQAMAPVQIEEQQQNYYTQQQQYTQQQIKSDPLDPSVKHSYIFNKYFKDYRDVNDRKVPEIRTPKTIEEYRQMVLEDKIKKIKEAHRIAQIKSRKLLFTGNPVIQQNGIHHSIKASKNNLRSMNFR